MSEDHKGFDAGDYNLFRYCGNDPEDRTDPMGLDPREVSPEVDRVSLEALETVRRISVTNSDGKCVGLERGKSVGPANDGRVEASKDTSVGEKIGNNTDHQRISYPDPPGGENGKRDSFVHAHTNENTGDSGKYDPKGTLTSQPDKKNGDLSDTTVYTSSRSGKIKERYRQSTDPAQRQAHKDTVTERLDKNGQWKVIEKIPPKKD